MYRFQATPTRWRWEFRAPDGQVVARISVRQDRRWISVWSLFVDPAHRRRGLATALIERAKLFAAKEGVPLFLRVAADNYPAIELYRARKFWITQHGPQRVGRTNMIWCPPGCRPLADQPANRSDDRSRSDDRPTYDRSPAHA